MEFISQNLQDTITFANEFAKSLKDGDVVALVGDLGAGKTTFVKAVCSALGVKEDVTSPTFT
ncbi:MAG: tRNA (adenosine(37)-N6)-threonylcarbamoyltransferase complex ATPase subunit type 1 TsaE, partial [Clostridia bacterium]|nr:tRNA (adenosine(37)-N6)-threonylcarbamoyltransferase complex ATPase subunit type 1 TsaE [Clostridia bacterium]